MQFIDPWLTHSKEASLRIHILEAMALQFLVDLTYSPPAWLTWFRQKGFGSDAVPRFATRFPFSLRAKFWLRAPATQSAPMTPYLSVPWLFIWMHFPLFLLLIRNPSQQVKAKQRKRERIIIGQTKCLGFMLNLKNALAWSCLKFKSWISVKLSYKTKYAVVELTNIILSFRNYGFTASTPIDWLRKYQDTFNG